MRNFLPTLVADKSKSHPPTSDPHTSGGKHLAIGRAALLSLHQEFSAYPKPGLVSPVDNGSHDDMNAATFFRSLFALRGYFCEIALIGMQKASLSEMQQLGFAAEQRMLRATQGINTHRGAIFNLGLLAAAAGFLVGEGIVPGYENLGKTVQERWGQALTSYGASLPKTSHGSLVAIRYGVGGAREEGAAGFPHLFNVALPEFERCLKLGLDIRLATIQCLFRLISVLPDSNLLYRGGEQGLFFAQNIAKDFLDAGGVQCNNWREYAVSIHHEFVARGLSPGGSADLLGATIFVHRLLLIKS